MPLPVSPSPRASSIESRSNEKVEALLATRTEVEARRLFTLCSQNQWVYADAKRALRSEDWRKELAPILYRPFDRRWTVYSRYVAVHRRERVSAHLVRSHKRRTTLQGSPAIRSAVTRPVPVWQRDEAQEVLRLQREWIARVVCYSICV